MQVIKLIYWEIGSYSLPSWIAFVSIAFSVARYSPRWCVPFGHLAVGVIVFFLDVAWVQSEMSKPSWNGTPDMDIVFHFGMLMRIVLINTLLLPVTALGMWYRKRRAALNHVPSSG